MHSGPGEVSLAFLVTSIHFLLHYFHDGKNESLSSFLLSLGWNLLLSYFSVFVLVWCLLDVTEQFCFLLLMSVGKIFGAGFQVFLGLLVIRLVMLIFCSLSSGAVASRLSTVLITLVWDHPTLSLSLLNRRCFGITDVRQTVLF